MRKVALYLALGAIACIGQSAYAQYATLIVNGTDYSSNFTVVPGNNPGDWKVNQTVLTVPGQFEVKMNCYMKFDPFISYGFTATNFTGGLMTFSLGIGAPISLGVGGTTVSGSVAGGLTDNTGNGVTIAPTGVKLQTATLNPGAVNMGVDVGNLKTGGPGAPGALYNFVDTKGPIAGPFSPPFTFMSTLTSFTLTGNGDIVAMNGLARIVPEPTTLYALGSGLGLLGLRLRRRRA